VYIGYKVDSLTELHRVIFPGIGLDIGSFSVSNVSNGSSHPLLIEGGYGNDLFYILHNKDTVTLNGNDGDDRIYADATPASSGSMNHVENAKVIVNGGTSYDCLFVNGTSRNDAFLLADGILIGAGLNITFELMESVYIVSKGGDDNVAVMDSHGIENTGTITIRTGSGNDVITVGNKQMAGVGSIFVDITVDGGDGSDTLTIDDSESMLVKNSTVTTHTVTGLLGKSSLGIMRSLIEKFHINMSQGSNTMTILSTAENTENIVTGFDGPDQIVVLGTGKKSSLKLHGGGGNDTMQLFALGAGTLLTMYGDDDGDTIMVDGTNGYAHPAVNLLDGSILRWSGGDGDDTMNVNLHSVGDVSMEIFDDVIGVNVLNLNCTDSDTVMVFKESSVVNLHNSSSMSATNDEIGLSNSSKIDRVEVWLNGGNNHAFIDDTFAMTSIYGGSSTDGKSITGTIK